MDWSIWLLIGFVLLQPIGVFAGRNWLKARIEKSIQHAFDEKIEKLRTELRKNEEAFKSDLRSKEMEISTLRGAVLSGRAQREALLDKRRMDAVERVWAAVMSLAPFKAISGFMAVINFDAVAKETPRNADLRKLFEIIGSQAPDPKAFQDPAQNEQPFMSPLAWAYFSAYRTIVLGAYLQAKVLELGVEDAGKFMNKEYARNLLKTVLPHQAEYIDKHGASAFHNLLSELETNLLAELVKMLEGAEVDQASLMKSAHIMKAVSNLVTASAEEQLKEVRAIDRPG